MNILIVANHYAVCSARYAADAFVRLGHTVKHVGQPMGRNIWGMQVPEEYVWAPDTEVMLPYPETVYAPDLTIIMDSDPTVLDALGDWAGNFDRQPMIVWGVDNHVRDYRRPYIDHYFLAHKSVSVMTWKSDEFVELYSMARAGGGDPVREYKPRTDMTWLPCAYDPVAFPPSPIVWEQRRYDVCMIGVMYPKRWELVAALRAAGLKVLAGTGLVYDAYRDAYHNSRVALVSSACGDLPIRYFEAVGMGCYPLCDPIADMNLLEKATAVIYRDVEGAVALARQLAEGESVTQDPDDVVKYLSDWSVNHTFDARAQVIIDWLEARR